MNAEQLHYTSCRHGRSGHAGFQVRSASPGLAAHERQEIERRAGYRPPRDLPPQPAPEQIAEEFPVALRYAPLAGGRALLLRATYCGRDYSGRWGNFFTHALVFDGCELAGAWPVDHADWPGWRACLGPDEDRAGSGGELPPVDLPEPGQDSAFSWSELREFLAEDRERPCLLADMGRAVLRGEEDSRRLVVRDLRTACWYWVACVTKLFPPRCARRLSFSTYEDDPRGAARINATCGDTDFTFDDTQRRFQFYAFDLVEGRCSEVPAQDGDYPAVAAGWMAREPERLQEFFAFMELFDHAAPAAELDAALRLFRIAEGAALPAGEELRRAIRFAVSHATDEGRRRLAGQLARAAEPALATLGAEEHRALQEFFARTAAATGLRDQRDVAHRVWLGTVNAVLEERFEPAVAQEGDELLREHLGGHRRELAELFLEALPARAAEDRRPDTGLFLLALTGRMLDALGRTPVWKQEEFVSTARTVLAVGGGEDRGLGAVLELVKAEPEGTAAVCELAMEAGIGGERVGRVLAGALADRPPALRDAVRRLLDRPETRPVLLGEWLQICAGSRDPATAFRRYRREVLDALPGYGREYRPAVTSSILQTLPDGERLSLVREWLESGEVESFPGDLAARCLAVANPAVDLLAGDAESDRWSREVARVAAARGIALRPDRPALRQALARLRKRPTGGSGDGFDPEALQAGLAALPRREYRQVVAAVLAPALARVADPEVHAQLLRAFRRGDETRAHAKAYRRFLSSFRRGEWRSALGAALGFYLAFDPDSSAHRPLSGLERPLRRTLVRALRHLRRDAFARVCREHRKTRSPHRARRWRELESAVRKRRRGLVARLRDLLP